MICYKDVLLVVCIIIFTADASMHSANSAERLQFTVLLQDESERRQLLLFGVYTEAR